MGKKKQLDAPGTEVAEAPVAAAPKASANAVTVKYRDHKGEPTERTFSADVHGENFAELAEEFKKSNASRIIAE